MVSRNFAATIKTGVAAFFVFSLSTLAFASNTTQHIQPKQPVTPQEREAYSKQFVQDRLQLWQQRLDLTNWNIHVNLLRTNQLEAGTLGNIHWDTDTQQATIAVLSSYDYKMSFQDMLDDMEFTVVHELVHLQLASLPHSAASRRIEEHAVNELASALLRLAKH